MLDECRAHSHARARSRSARPRVSASVVSPEMVGEVLQRPRFSLTAFMCPSSARKCNALCGSASASCTARARALARTAALAVHAAGCGRADHHARADRAARHSACSARGCTPPLSGAQIVCSVALTMLGVVVHELGHLQRAPASARGMEASASASTGACPCCTPK